MTRTIEFIGAINWHNLSKDQREAAIVSLNQEGLDRARIAKRLGCAISTLNGFIQKNRVTYAPVSPLGNKANAALIWEQDASDARYRQFIEHQDRRFCDRMIEVGGSFA